MKLDGKEIADQLYIHLEKRVEKLQKRGITPYVTVFLIGQIPASVAYVSQKEKKGSAVGAKVTILRYEETVTTEELAKEVKKCSLDPAVHGILIQRPVPEHIDIDKLVLLTDPQKDVDGFHPDSPYTLPLPLAVVKILEEIYLLCHSDRTRRFGGGVEESHATALHSKHSGVRSLHSLRSVGMTRQKNSFKRWLKSQNIVITGKGTTGGGPIIAYLHKLGITTRLIDSKTPNPAQIMKKADIVITAVGRKNIIKPEMLKKGVILIGVGIYRGEDGKLHGDYDEEQIQDIASFYTPTPGGVGPVNVAMLFDNLITATEKQSKNIS